MINVSRHQQIFDPRAFNKRRVDVIGCGATGSRIVMDLVRLGIQNINVWDYDTVGAENLSNQLYEQADIGQDKVKAITQQAIRVAGTKIVFHKQRVDSPQSFGPVVFLLTDTKESRREIWEQSIKFKISCELLIETRLAPELIRIYSIYPSRLSHIQAYEKTLEGKASSASACGSPISVGPTAEVLSGLATWQLIKWFNLITKGQEAELDNEITLSLRPLHISSRKFE